MLPVVVTNSYNRFNITFGNPSARRDANGRNHAGLQELLPTDIILCLGLSVFLAWRVAPTATMAVLCIWTPLAGVQLEYSLAK